MSEKPVSSSFVRPNKESNQDMGNEQSVSGVHYEQVTGARSRDVPNNTPNASRTPEMNTHPPTSSTGAQPTSGSDASTPDAASQSGRLIPDPPPDSVVEVSPSGAPTAKGKAAPTKRANSQLATTKATTASKTSTATAKKTVPPPPVRKPTPGTNFCSADGKQLPVSLAVPAPESTAQKSAPGSTFSSADGKRVTATAAGLMADDDSRDIMALFASPIRPESTAKPPPKSGNISARNPTPGTAVGASGKKPPTATSAASTAKSTPAATSAASTAESTTKTKPKSGNISAKMEPLNSHRSKQQTHSAPIKPISEPPVAKPSPNSTARVIEQRRPVIPAASGASAGKGETPASTASALAPTEKRSVPARTTKAPPQGLSAFPKPGTQNMTAAVAQPSSSVAPSEKSVGSTKGEDSQDDLFTKYRDYYEEAWNLGKPNVPEPGLPAAETPATASNGENSGATKPTVPATTKPPRVSRHPSVQTAVVTTAKVSDSSAVTEATESATTKPLPASTHPSAQPLATAPKVPVSAAATKFSAQATMKAPPVNTHPSVQVQAAAMAPKVSVSAAVRKSAVPATAKPPPVRAAVPAPQAPATAAIAKETVPATKTPSKVPDTTVTAKETVPATKTPSKVPDTAATVRETVPATKKPSKVPDRAASTNETAPVTKKPSNVLDTAASTMDPAIATKQPSLVNKHPKVQAAAAPKIPVTAPSFLANPQPVGTGNPKLPTSTTSSATTASTVKHPPTTTNSVQKDPATKVVATAPHLVVQHHMVVAPPPVIQNVATAGSVQMREWALKQQYNYLDRNRVLPPVENNPKKSVETRPQPVRTAPPAKPKPAASRVVAKPIPRKQRPVHDPLLLVEDMLSPDRHQFAYSKYSQLPDPYSLRIHPIPPKTIGGIQDQVHPMQVSCTCRRSSTKVNNGPASCLKKYCECFMNGMFCGMHCQCSSTCSNNGAPENAKRRMIAIANELAENPHAFRQTFANIAELQKKHREALADSAARAIRNSSPNNSGGSKVKISDLGKLDSAQKKQPADEEPQTGAAEEEEDQEALRVQLPPSFYTIPLRDDKGLVIRGISFSLTHPLHRKRKHTPRKRPRYTVPSGSPTDGSNQAQPSPVISGEVSKVGKTGLVELWEKKEHERRSIIQLMRNELDESGEVSGTPGSPDPLVMKKRAHETMNTAKEDMQGMHAAVDAAKVNIQSLFYNTMKSKRGGATGQGSVDSDVEMTDRGNGSDAVDDTHCSDNLLFCYEHLPNIGDQVPCDESKLQDLTLFVAQDTAILHETTRIVKRLARELAEKRLQRNI